MRRCAKQIVFLALAVGLADRAQLGEAATPVLRAADYGVVGDGVRDDGPALQQALAALRRHAPPVTLRFEPGKTYRIRSAPQTWAFSLLGLRDFTIDGGGSTFVLDASLRFIHVNGCTNAAVQNLALDFDPLPFADGLVVAKNPTAKSVDVKIGEAFALPPLGGPTRRREQAYFAMLWHPGRHGLMGEHYFLRDTQEAYPGSLKQRIVRAFSEAAFDHFDGISEGRTRISLPVPGVAHRMHGFGASPAVVIEENESVRFENVSIWSAPLFAVNVARNRGRCVFRRFDIRPRPGAGRLTSAWRDGFHVKGNYADLLWEDCHLEGMNDDAFNIATHSSYVSEVLSPQVICVRQNFPLGFVPFLPGDTLAGFGLGGGRLLGEAKVVGVAAEAAADPANPDRPAVPLRITLDRTLSGIGKRDVVWNQSSANPRTILRRCTIKMSCRLQSPVTIENCDITALCWFYGDNIEGPLPRNVVIKDSRLKQGRGNAQIVAAFGSLIQGPDGRRVQPRQPVITRVRLENNTIDGLLDIGDVEDLSLVGNRFVAPHGKLAIHDSRQVLLQDNFLGNTRIDRVEQIEALDEATRRAIVVKPSRAVPRGKGGRE